MPVMFSVNVDIWAHICQQNRFFYIGKLQNGIYEEINDVFLQEINDALNVWISKAISD
jgi:hypothetical protein